MNSRTRLEKLHPGQRMRVAYTCELPRIVILLGRRVADSERRMFMDNVVNCTIEIYFLIRHFLDATCYYSDKGNFY